MTKLGFGESERVEFKKCVGKKSAKAPEDLWQSVSAFANTRGGSIYLGVSKTGEVAGLSASELDFLQCEVSGLVNNKFFNVKPRIRMTVCGGFLEIEISEAEFYNKPIFSRKVGPRHIWIRQGSTTVEASDEEKKSMFAGASGGGENQLVQGDIDNLIEESKIEDYISRTGLKDLFVGDIRERLAKIKALKDNELTVFGLLAFSKDGKIDELLNNVYIDFRHFPGLEKVTDDLEMIYLDRMEFHGDIRDQFVKAFNYIKSKLPKEAILNKETGLREDRYILPEEAFREALANTVAHRDYVAQSSCINIDLFSDRIELSNPGESLVSIENLEKTASKARNPNIIEYLKAYRITDKSARGIPTMYRAARHRGLLDPKFENISGNFKATLYFSSPHSGKDKEWVDSIAIVHSLKDTQKNALVHIKNNGSISNGEYCEINHMDKRNDDKKARRELGDMVVRKLLETEGVKKGTRYILSKEL